MKEFASLEIDATLYPSCYVCERPITADKLLTHRIDKESKVYKPICEECLRALNLGSVLMPDIIHCGNCHNDAPRFSLLYGDAMKAPCESCGETQWEIGDSRNRIGRLHTF